MATVKKAKAVMKKISDVALMDVPNISIFGFSLVNKNPKYNGKIEEDITNEYTEFAQS